MKKLWKNIKRWKYQILIVIGLLYFGSLIYRHKNMGNFNPKMALLEIYQIVNTEEVVKKALGQLKKYRLIPAFEKNKKNITEVLQETAQKEGTLTMKMRPMIDFKAMGEVEKQMSGIIGRKRVDLIKNSFTIETFRMKVVKKPDGQSAVQIHRKGGAYLPDIILKTVNDINNATMVQWISLVVELFFCLEICVGIVDDLNELSPVYPNGPVYQNVEALVRESAFQRQSNEFLKAWKEAGGNAWEKAKAIVYFLKYSSLLEVFWKSTKLIFKNMSTGKRIRAIAEVCAMIVAAFSSSLLALIARIALAVNDGVKLIEKIGNFDQFSEMKKTMKYQ